MQLYSKKENICNDNIETLLLYQNIKICFQLVRERIPAEQNFYSDGTLSRTNCVCVQLVPSFRFILLLHFEC